ncbi:MAG: methionine gamma-lyase family protein [Bacillota bacterium]
MGFALNTECGQFHPQLIELAKAAEKAASQEYSNYHELSARNHQKVLGAFRTLGVTDFHLHGSTGYGYGDLGRDLLDRLFAKVLGAERALVRTHIVSGTHAISLCLFGVLRPGDELIFATGKPYDTLNKVIGDGPAEGYPGSLMEWGITCREVELLPDGSPDLAETVKAISSRTRMVAIQRSRGYQWRPTLSSGAIGEIIARVKKTRADIVCFVDNCYGELVEAQEPTECGADLMAGSLIKNPGGGIAPAGGYIAGKAALVEQVAQRLTAPGLGAELGATLDTNRLLYQGLYFAPLVVQQALMGAVFAGHFFSSLGFEVSPQAGEKRSDIIQAIKLGTRERLIAFCQGIQQGSPVDSHALPEPAGVPGYGRPVIMAAGTFIQGSSIELSADGPLEEPFIAYLQGGISAEYVKLAVLHAAQRMFDQGLLNPMLRII